MSSITSAAAMKLLDIRLKHAGSIITSAIGEFSTSGVQEIVCLRAGGTIDLFRIVITNVSTENNDDDEEDEEEEVQTTLKLLKRVETRSTLRSLTAIRISGSKKDVILVGADGGCLSLIAFDTATPANNKNSDASVTYKIIHCPSFGKSGCRRDTPGQYLASDPRGGRAVMIASTEKRKLVYVLNRDSGGNITIASPLEAHRPRTVVFDLVGVDNGFDNPIFASLEVQYPEYEDAVLAERKKKTDEEDHEKMEEEERHDVELGQHGDGYTKQLAYYELDLGLNHVSRRWATSTVRSACCLAAIPGGLDGPSGVLVGGEDYIEYLHEGMSPPSSANGNNKITPKRLICAIPRRELHPKSKGILITTISVLRQKKGKFFALAQSELGDVYKVTLQMSKEDKTVVTHMTICLLDTLPIGNGLNISKLALLFVPAEFGDHGLYQFDAIDIEDSAVKFTSEETISAFVKSGESSEDAFYASSENAAAIVPTFRPTILRNMHKVFTLDSLAPVTSVLVGELAGNEVSPQFYTLCGRGPRSSLRILRHGLSVTELAVSELPGVPGGVFNVRDDRTTKNGKFYDRYIVVSFADATLVLSVGETVEEMGKESGFLTSDPTLACSALGNGDKDGGIVQVCPGGVRHIRRVNNQVNVSQWSVPGIKKIECASANESQILIALAGGELIYFELDPMSGNLTEACTRDIGTDVCCLDVGPVPKGKSRSLFAVVGSRDSNVRLLSLAPASLLEPKSSTTLGATKPYSAALSIVDGGDGASELTMTVGLEDGSALRANVDPITGAISTSPSRRFLGARPVSVSRVTLDGSPSTLLLSSRPWIGRNGNGRHSMAPMSYAPLDHGCSFSNEAVREGIVATSGTTLRILSVGENGGNNALLGNDDDEAFNATNVSLRYTPRQMCLLSAKVGETGKKIVLALVESDYNDYGAEEKKSMGFDGTGRLKTTSKKIESKSNDDAMDMDEDSDDDANNEEKKEEADEEDEDDINTRLTPIRGPVPSGKGHWGSCVRLVDPQNACSTLDCVELNRNEAALCCASVRFHSRGGESLLAVGTVTSMTMHPLGHKESHVVLYRVVNGDRLQFLHRTKVDDGPVLSLVHFQGRLLVGIGRTLRLYEMGKRQLLKKCELRGLPTMVKTLHAAGDRAYVGDMMQSLHFIRYDSTANRLVLVARDRSSRPITCQELLDMNTVAVGDKFGNVSILRLPGGADVGAIDVTGTRALWDSSREDATPKLETLCTYHVGEVVTSMTRASLVAGGAESLVYVTVTGRVGAFVPFTSREDVEFYTSLEGYLRVEAPRPTGRDPQAYRSYYAPTKHIIDGDLCDAYAQLPYETKQKIAEQLDRSVGEVMKKLEDTKNALL
ncbi:spliceosome associated factor 3b, subunit 3 [Skeletonema marinoi]|uniref:Spliceosome associated factor 3b, subunit 3 n=1 Tax=Skeletonema marinoi TaxID=267567 RepID=A0AAD8YLA8_9STRA|nr:spliceosome associated factor 3b, subunit 3 [Skeletonema marinoi]